ncbi:MAG: hypothetical protein IPM29_02735 [Planctomycetes bacterium]|nr:hypothetical protein [Planctomycetota bacterium]
MLTTTLRYDDPAHPDQVTSVIDPRDVTVLALSYDPAGRVHGRSADGGTTTFVYADQLAAGGIAPQPLGLLEPTNFVTRVVDGAGKVVDSELHGSAGGPLGGKGAFGLRRRVVWTRKAVDGTAPRTAAPVYYEQRFLHDSDALTPVRATRMFAAGEPAGFDPYRMPVGIPTEELTYNAVRQIERWRYSDGADAIEWQRTYPPHNAREQLQTVTDGNGNVTTFEYFTDTTPSTDIDHQGHALGYLAAETFGANGSAQQVTALRTEYCVNNLGMVTRVTDPRGATFARRYRALGAPREDVGPAVVHDGGMTANYVRQFHLDRTGRLTLTRWRNLDHTGGARTNGRVDTVVARDAWGRTIAERREVDADPTHDLVTRTAYDALGGPIASMKPAGNREFTVYDEGGLVLRTFAGVSAPVSRDPLESYPGPTATTLPGGATFLRMRSHDYDSRGNRVRDRDGRGSVWTRAFDFRDREVLRSSARVVRAARPRWPACSRSRPPATPRTATARATPPPAR